MLRQIKIFILSLIYSVKRVSDLFNAERKDDVVSLQYGLESNNLYNDLLQEQITQDVIELRHKSYVVAEESKKYKYIGNGLSEFNNKQVFNKNTYLDDDKYHLFTVMDNKLLEESLYESFKRVDKEEINGQEYTLKVTRNFAPIHRIEEFANKFVIKRNVVNEYRVDIYTSIYKNPHNLKQRAFLNNLNNMLNGAQHSNEIIDINTIEFITYKAFNLPDLLMFKFNNLKYRNITKFDGNYIISFDCYPEIEGNNLIEKYIDINTELKYKIKASKN